MKRESPSDLRKEAYDLIREHCTPDVAESILACLFWARVEEASKSRSWWRKAGRI